jgi:hypothetical protein
MVNAGVMNPAPEFSNFRCHCQALTKSTANPPTPFNLHSLRVEILNVMESTDEFSPEVPLPEPFDVEERIQELRGYLDLNNPDYQPEQQHTNIKAAIKLYENISRI